MRTGGKEVESISAIFLMWALAVTVVMGGLGAGCSTGGARASSGKRTGDSGAGLSAVEREKVRWVRVKVVGEVNRKGELQIKSRFSQADFLEAVDGLATYENVIHPNHFRLTRYENYMRQEWKIYFKDMPKHERKGFEFKDGDEIYVPRLYF